MKPWWAPVPLIAGLAALSLVPRLLHLFSQSTIPDEAFTWFIAAHPVQHILLLTKTGDVHPPLVYLLGHVLLAFSVRTFVFRLIAVAFGIVGVIATYFIARRIVSAAWLPAVLVALCPILVFYDRFFRMYAILWSLSMLSWLLLLRALETPQRSRRWVGYGAAVAALLYTHYLAFFCLIAQAIFMVAQNLRQWRFAAALGAAVFVWLPWLPAFWMQLPKGGTAFNAVARSASQVFLIPGYLFTDGLPVRLEFHPAYLALLWLLIAAGIAAAAHRRAWLVLWLLLPLALQALFSLTSGKFLLTQRYLLQAIPPLAITVTFAITYLWGTRGRIIGVAAAAGITALMVAGTVDKLFLPQYQPVDWRIYSGFLQKHLQPGDAIVFDDIMPYFTLIDAPFMHHHPVYPISNQNQANAYAERIARYRRVWYINYQSQFSDPQRVIFRALRRTHPKATSWKSTESGYGDFVLTTLFVRLGRATGP